MMNGFYLLLPDLDSNHPGRPGMINLADVGL